MPGWKCPKQVGFPFKLIRTNYNFFFIIHCPGKVTLSDDDQL